MTRAPAANGYDYERPGLVPTATCLRCGAGVTDVPLHTRWHDGMCAHRDADTGLTCMQPMPCYGPHRSDLSTHTWTGR